MLCLSFLALVKSNQTDYGMLQKPDHKLERERTVSLVAQSCLKNQNKKKKVNCGFI